MPKKGRGAGPEELVGIKKELQGVKRRAAASVDAATYVSAYVRLAKSSTQLVGAGNRAAVVWQDAPYEIGGTADLANNRFVVPADKPGLWRVRAVVHMDGASVTDGSNYKLEIELNGVVGSRFTNNHSGSSRDTTASIDIAEVFAAGDTVKLYFTNNTSGGQVTIKNDARMFHLFLGFIA